MRDKFGRTHLHAASAGGHKALVNLLLAAGAGSRHSSHPAASPAGAGEAHASSSLQLSQLADNRALDAVALAAKGADVLARSRQREAARAAAAAADAAAASAAAVTPASATKQARWRRG